MPYLRCEQCGAKALPIASRCPSCEHPFPSRRSLAGSDGGRGFRGRGIGRGIDRRRERACAECDSLILRSADECRWCGAPQESGLSKRAIRGIGAVAAVVILAAGFHFWGPNADVVFLSGGSGGSPPAGEVQSEERVPTPPAEGMRGDRTPAQSDEQLPVPPEGPGGVSAETRMADAGGETDGNGVANAGSPTDATSAGRPADTDPATNTDRAADTHRDPDLASATDLAGMTDPTSSADAPARSADRASANSDSPPPVSAETEVADDPASRADPSTFRSDSGWVHAVARTFVNVRAVPSSEGEVQGVVPENADVLLGDSRGAWRRVRMAGVTGWAWEPLFQIGSDTEGS